MENETVSRLTEAINSITEAELLISGGNSEIIADCQNLAIEIGNTLEQYSNTFQTVKMLEEYCEMLYEAYINKSEHTYILQSKIRGDKLNQIKQALKEIEDNDNVIKKDLLINDLPANKRSFEYWQFYFKERSVSFGDDNPDKTFYIIRRKAIDVGLFSYIITFLANLDYADKNGLIPIIDMQTSPNIYLENDEVGKKNAWEYFFNQPSKYSVDDVKNSKNIILSSGIPFKERPSDSMYFFNNTGGKA